MNTLLVTGLIGCLLYWFRNDLVALLLGSYTDPEQTEQQSHDNVVAKRAKLAASNQHVDYVFDRRNMKNHSLYQTFIESFDLDRNGRYVWGFSGYMHQLHKVPAEQNSTLSVTSATRVDTVNSENSQNADTSEWVFSGYMNQPRQQVTSLRFSSPDSAVATQPQQAEPTQSSAETGFAKDKPAVSTPAPSQQPPKKEQVPAKSTADSAITAPLKSTPPSIESKMATVVNIDEKRAANQSNYHAPSDQVVEDSKQAPATQEDVTATSGSMALFEAPTDYQDDLKEIKGIGVVIENILNGLGVTTFVQIADFTTAEVEQVRGQLGQFSGRIERDSWISQASELHENKYGIKRAA